MPMDEFVQGLFQFRGAGCDHRETESLRLQNSDRRWRACRRGSTPRTSQVSESRVDGVMSWVKVAGLQSGGIPGAGAWWHLPVASVCRKMGGVGLEKSGMMTRPSGWLTVGIAASNPGEHFTSPSTSKQPRTMRGAFIRGWRPTREFWIQKRNRFSWLTAHRLPCSHTNAASTSYLSLQSVHQISDANHHTPRCGTPQGEISAHDRGLRRTTTRD